MRSGITVTFTKTMEIWGYTKYDENFWPVNFITYESETLYLLLFKNKTTSEYFSASKGN